MEWLSENGLAAIKKMGWPEWEDAGRRRALRRVGTGRICLCDPREDGKAPDDRFWVWLSAREVVALQRDDARVWLEKIGLPHGPIRVYGFDGHYTVEDDAGFLLNANGKWEEPSSDYRDHPTYDSALIAAILAAEED